MRYYLDKTVLDAAKERIEYLFDEFDEVIAWTSGGKDSTVIFHLTLEIARKRGRLPLKVAFLDQEAEWEHTIKYIRKIMDSDEIEPLWFQMPLKLFNATSYTEDWLMCWNPEEEDTWMRPKESYSIKENNFGTERFKDLMHKITPKLFPDKKVANIAGVRCEESPNRLIALTYGNTYKGITWGCILDKKIDHYTFYPLYDWSYTDIWKYIHDNKITYNKIYDFQFMHGVNIQNMRVSNLHHETAIQALFYMQEVEPDTYNKLTARIGGIDSATKFNKDDFFIYELPYMFRDWEEYRDYLLEKLVDDKYKENFKKWFVKFHNEFGNLPFYERVVKAEVNAILANDYTGTKLHNLEVTLSTKKTRLNRKSREGQDEI